jgi:hypothetical protein
MVSSGDRNAIADRARMVGHNSNPRDLWEDIRRITLPETRHALPQRRPFMAL